MKTESSNAIHTKCPSIEKRLAGYGTMSLAIAAAVAPNANASAISWSPGVTTPLGGGIYFNVVTGETTVVNSNSLEPGSLDGEFALENLSAPPSFVQDFFLGSANNKFAVSPATSNPASLSPYPTSAARLAVNTMIGPGLAFDNPELLTSSGGGSFRNNVFPSLASNFGDFGQWNDLGTGYLGLTFDIGSQTDYGWAKITVNADYTVTLDAIGYDDTGNAIAAGAADAPEPNSLLLMALGAAGLAGYRRKQSAKATQQSSEN